MTVNTFAVKPHAITVPDLRFEHSFIKSLQAYANDSAKRTAKTKNSKSGSAKQCVDGLPVDDIIAPVAPITPAIVIYAVIKDVILRPLLEGFLWSSTLLLVKPTLRLVTAFGRRSGLWLIGQIGLRR